jgi:hypothetical protein
MYLLTANATLNSDNVNVNATNTKIRDDQLRSRRRKLSKWPETVADNGRGYKADRSRNNSRRDHYNGRCSVAGSVALNGGANGGVPKGAALVTEFNKLKEDFADLQGSTAGRL